MSDFYLLNTKTKVTKEEVGGKGYYLHQMHEDGLPVPHAAFITTDLWKEYRKNPKKVIEKLKKTIIPAITDYLKSENGGVMPLVSVRSAGAVSMPGMMDTILNVGVSQKYFKEIGVFDEKNQSVKSDEDKASEDKAKKPPAKGKSTKKSAKNGRKAAESLDDILSGLREKTVENFAADNYARFLSMYGATVLGIPKEKFPVQKKWEKVSDVLVAFEEVYKKAKKDMPPDKPDEQILNCILAVFDSWDNDRAVLYRKLNNIDNSAGTAVVVQRMVFGNKNDLSATGVMFSRNPSSGQNTLTGEYLTNAQGEDVVSGSHTPKNMNEMRDEFPDAYEELKNVSETLEKKYKQMQDIEFTIEDDKVFILQARTAKCSPYAKLKMLMDMQKTGAITSDEVFNGLSLKEYLDLNIKQVDQGFDRPADGKGLPASMGALSGRIVFGPSYKYKDEPTVFVAKETTPDDLEAIQMSAAILTASGGATSHAAVVARGMGKVCVVGCNDLKVNMEKQEIVLGSKKLGEGEWITIDANSGKVWAGKDIPIVDAQNSPLFWSLEQLVMDANPEWTRVTGKVDEIVNGNKTYYLTYELDEAEDDFIAKELRDALDYLTGTMDLTGKLDYLEKKYPGQFLFSDVNAERIFLKKKDILKEVITEVSVFDLPIEIYLGDYEKKHGAEIRAMGFKIKPSGDVTFNKKGGELVVTQQFDPTIPKEKLAISSKNALLAVLK